MSHGDQGKRRRAVSDWVVRPLESRVLLSQAAALPPSANPAAIVAHAGLFKTTTTLEASTQLSARHPTVTMNATVTAPGLVRPVSGGLVRFSIVSPTPEFLGAVRTDSHGVAKLRTDRIGLGETYVVRAQFTYPGRPYAPSVDQLDVAVAPSEATTFRISAPQYFGAPGTPVTFSVTALNRAGRPVRGYTGTIHFVSPTDHSATLLARTYTFTTADHGTHAFPDGITFHKGGAEILKVSQLNNTKITTSQTFGIE